MNRVATWLGLMIAASAASQCSADLLISQYDPARNDRFDGSTSFIARPYDLSPVGKTNNGTFATLISQNFALTADHVHVPVGTTVSFFNNDNPTVVETATVVGVTNIVENNPPVPGGPTTSDLDLLRLAVSSATVTPVSLVADQQSQLLNSQIFVYGQPNRVGTNNIDQFGTLSGYGGNTTYAYSYNYNPNASPNEALLQTGDSGGPSLVVAQGGVLALAGIHSAATTPGDPNPTSVDTFVGYYIPAIEADISAQVAEFGLTPQQITVRSVPEPASLALMGVGVLAVAARLRRRAA